MPKMESTEVGKIGIAALFYKCIITAVEVETKAAAVAHIRTNLTNLQAKMNELNFDITAFHGYVQQLIVSLASHGKISEDLTVYLFQTYESVPDEGFLNNVIKRKLSDYRMGDQDLESRDLTNFAQKCYNVRTTDTFTPWLQKSKEKLEFEALTANFHNLKSINERLAKALKAKVTNDTKKGTFKTKIKSKPNVGNFAWKDVAPKKDDPKTKEVNGKTYHWCPKHKARTLHKPEDECRLKEHVAHVTETDENSEGQNNDEDEDTIDDHSALALAAAFAMDS